LAHTSTAVSSCWHLWRARDVLGLINLIYSGQSVFGVEKIVGSLIALRSGPGTLLESAKLTAKILNYALSKV